MTKTVKVLADDEARERIKTDLDTTLVVEAAAGTGKTTALVGRILAGIVSGRVRLAQIVAVTFTDFAAGELKLRLRSAIEDERKKASSPEVQERLNSAVEELEEARIGTIHSFCSDLLKEHPVEAGIDPQFEVAPDEMTAPLFAIAFERWFEQQLQNPGDGVRRILRRPARKGFGGGRAATLAQRPRESGPKPVLRSAAWELIKDRDYTSPWRQPEGFNREAEIDALIDEMRELGHWSESGKPDEWLTKSLANVKIYEAELTRLESLGEPRDYDGIEARLFSFLSSWRGKDWKAYYGRDDWPAAELRQRRDELKDNVKKFVDSAGADLAPLLRNELWEVVESFEQLKEHAGYVDFVDLLLRARNLIRDNREIRVELQERFTHIFVDEFQDTDPLQAEMLMLLAADDTEERDWRKTRPLPGKLFIVGDPKQSIYRFRRADVALYQEIKRQIVATGGALVDLNVSFRAVPAIQSAVNAAFAPVMTNSVTQAQYVSLKPSRVDVETQPAIIALPVSKPYGDYGKVVNWKIDESAPTDVAAFVNWLINESGWTVTERGQADKRVPLEARHVCLLFRRFRHYATDVTKEYVQALEAYRIPHLLVGGSSFHARDEVEAIRNAVNAIEWPDDEVAVFATLRGPLFAFSDSQLLAYRHLNSSLHPFKEPAADLPPSLGEVVDALAILRELHRGRNYRPIAETIQSLLSRTRAHAGFANWPTGEQALANIMRLTDMARRAERNGMNSFRAFVDWLDEEAESGDVGDAPIMEEGVDGVRIMTVHKAKGLEFPVVILVDITAKDSREPSKWVDQATSLSAMKLAGCLPIEVQENAAEEQRREEEEAARVLYVAATRARDLLVVTAVGDFPYEGWLDTLNPAIYPANDNSFNPEAKQIPGGPLFGADTVVDRPQNAHRGIGSVSPGLHQPQAGDHRVVWWDPATLAPASSQTRSGSRLTEYLKEDDARLRSEQGVRAHDDWQAQRARVRSEANVPEFAVLTATGLPSDSSLQRKVTIESLQIDFKRPHGKRFGSLVHALLSFVELDADSEALEEVASVHGRILGATTNEVEAAVETVQRALSHKLLRRAAAAEREGRCRREIPVALKLDDGSIVEGVVDLAFQDDENGSWTVVDYKTDFEVKGRLEDYERQVSLYALAIARATEREATGVLLRM